MIDPFNSAHKEIVMRTSYKTRWGIERKRALKGNTRTRLEKHNNPPTKGERLDPKIRNGDNPSWNILAVNKVV